MDHQYRLELIPTLGDTVTNETQRILNRLSAKNGSASDYRIAKLLGVRTQTVSNWRVGKGTFSDETALKIADLLGENPAYLLALAQSERTESEPARQVYREIAEHFSRHVATILIALAAGLAGGFHAENAAAAAPDAAKNTVQSMDYAQSSRRIMRSLRDWINTQLRRLICAPIAIA